MRRTTRALTTSLQQLAGAALAVATATLASDALSAAPVTGQTVAVLELAAPPLSEFILRGTIPVPPGTFPRADGLAPFAIQDSNGALVPAQVERVTGYANEAQGADVVEVLARVHRPTGAATGSRIQYSIVDSPHLVKRPTLTPTVRAFLTTPNAVRLTTRDVFGTTYKVDLREGALNRKVLRNGSEVLSMRYYGMLKPLTGGSGSTAPLPHLGGVHSYVSYWSNEDVITIDLRVHNGASNLDKTNSIDDCQKQLYFDALNVLVPKNWVVLQDFEDPYLGQMRTTPNYDFLQMVKPMADGTYHVLPVRGQISRRIAITPAANVARARAFLDQALVGFCRPGSNAQGQPLWSWWNPSTARYFPQRHRLPEFAHLGESNIRGRYNWELNHYIDALTSGVSFNSYPIHSPVLGWAHPWGIKYGGMTGGTEIYLYEGHLAAYGASNEGYRLMTLRHRMFCDRQPNNYYNKSGEPTSFHDWIVHGTNFDYVPSAFYNGVVGQFDMFGFNQAPTHHVDYAIANGLTPPYETDLFQHEPIDLQHLVRYLISPKVLVWLGNDAMAKDDILMQAEVGRLSYHHLPTSPGGQAVTTGMLADIQFVNAHPDRGFGYGRDNGWINDAMLAAYSFEDSAWRAQAKPWFDRQVDLLQTGQTSCTGAIQAVESNQLLIGQYRARQSIEQAIVENSLWSMLQSVYKGADAVRELQTRDVLEASTYSMIGFPCWNSQLDAPNAVVAIGPLDLNLPVFCTVLPPDGSIDGGGDKYMPWSSFAYGFELTGDPTFLQRAFEMAGSQNDLLWELQNDGWQYIENRVALFSLVYSNNYP